MAMATVQRFGRVLRLREGAEAEYERLHAQIWPEVLKTIRRAGIRNYSIYRYGQWLFSYFELPEGVSLEDVGAVCTRSEACSRWEKEMHAFQEPLPESQGEVWWVPMKEVFNCP